MTDTPAHIYAAQRAIIATKTPAERFQMVFDMIEYSRMVVTNSIKAQQPDISLIDLKVAVFRRFYKHDFSATALNEIEKAMQAREGK
jgi:hypothetical protein